MMLFKKSFYLLGLLSFLTACSGGGGGGVPKATITAANSQDLSIAATESAIQAVNADSANFLAKISGNTSTNDLITSKIRDITFEATTLGPVSAICPTGGSYSDNISAGTSSASGSITFVNCGIDVNITINGSVTFTSTQTTITMVYNNFTVTTPDGSETLTASMSCSLSNTTVTSCEITSTTVTGIDNRTYIVSNAKVSGDSNSGYSVSASVTDPTHGTITISATAITFNCTAPNADRPSSGTVSFSSNSKTGSVVFDSCSSYTVTLDGVADSYNW